MLALLILSVWVACEVPLPTSIVTALSGALHLSIGEIVLLTWVHRLEDRLRERRRRRGIDAVIVSRVSTVTFKVRARIISLSPLKVESRREMVWIHD